MGKLTDKVAKGVIWIMLARGGVQTVHFLVALVLARLLAPGDYGTVALVSVFITFSDILLDCGVCSALVRKKDAVSADYSTVFYLNLSMSILFYLLLFSIAPLVARFYDVAELCPMMRVLAVNVVFKGLSDIQEAVLRKKMLFKLSFRISWPKVVVASAVGIWLAFAGYGPWALVWSSVSGAAVDALMRQIVVAWRPTLEFSWASARELFGFGWKFAAARVMQSIGSSVSSLCIGRIYSRADLAFYSKGSHLPKVLENFAQMALGRAAFPALSRIQDDMPRLRSAMRRMIRMSTFLCFPVLVLCTVLAKPLMVVLFGEKWLPAAPFVGVACIALAFRPFDAINFQAINAIGRSDIYLRLMVLRRVLGLAILVSTIRFGVLQFALAMAIFHGPVSVLINAWPNRRLLGYGFAMQLRDVFPSLLLAAAMSAVVGAVAASPLPAYAALAVGAAAGVSAYACLAVALRYGPVVELLNVVASVTESRLPAVSALARRMGRRIKG